MTARSAWLTLATAALCTLQPLVSSAQLTMMSRTPQLARLEVFVGQWQRRAAQPPAGSQAPVAAQLVAGWAPGDLWMTWDVEIEFTTGQTVYGRRQIAWNERQGVFTSSWIDTQSALIIEATARWVDDTTFEVLGEPIAWPDGKSYRFKTQYRVKSPTVIQETGWRSVDDGPFEQHNQADWTKNGPSSS